MPYEDQIADLFDKHVTNRPAGGSLAPLFAALGCAHVADPLAISKGALVRCAPVYPEHEALIRDTLVQIMHSHVRRAGNYCSDEDLALLGALAQHDRWRSCLDTMDGAIDFGLLLSYFWVADPTLPGQELMITIGPAVFELVNCWLQPAPPFVPYDVNRAASYDLAVCLFGGAWCALAMSDLEKSPQDIPERLRILRPPVLENLLPAHLHTTPLSLPSMEAL